MSTVRRLLSKLKSGLDALLAPAEDPRQTFTDAYKRQRVLLVKVEQALAEQGKSPEQSDLAEMDALWNQVKKQTPG